MIKVPLYKDALLDRWEVQYSLTNPASNWKEVWEWCWQTFGHPGFNTNTHQRVWDYHGGFIRFYDEKCVTMYLLRWT